MFYEESAARAVVSRRSVGHTHLAMQPLLLGERLAVMACVTPHALTVLAHILGHRLPLQLRREQLRLAVVPAVLLHRDALQLSRHLLRLRVVLVHRHALAEATHGCDASRTHRRSTGGRRYAQRIAAHRGGRALPQQRARQAHTITAVRQTGAGEGGLCFDSWVDT